MGNEQEMTASVACARQLRKAAQRARQRRMLVLAGASDWGRSLALRMAREVMGRGAWLWMGEAAPEAVGDGTPWRQVDAARADSVLGGEFDLVVLDGHHGLSADALGAVSGTIRAGGLLLLLMPSMANGWRDVSDAGIADLVVFPWTREDVGRRFLVRAAQAILADDDTVVVEAGSGPSHVPPWPAENLAVETTGDGCLTAEQAAAVDALCHVVHGQRRRPVVLVADRGRGKSAALGIAAARLLDEAPRRIIITAPRRAAVAAAFERVEALSPQPLHHQNGGLVRGDGGALLFRAPEELVAGEDQGDLVLVDEAAAIPAHMLQTMLERCSRIAFATTVHGYEGTGRGFEVRFREALDRDTRGWTRLTLQQPVRWAAADPVESLVARILLLDAEPVVLPPESPSEEVMVERLDRGELADDEETLSRAFGLLVQAHYRTRPQDLRQLLDGPNLRLAVARSRGVVVGVVLWALEGGFDATTSEAILRGGRRPYGHLLPETLAAHMGLEAAPRLRAARVVRLAVHSDRRRRGIGGRLLEAVWQSAREEGCDLVGSSFAVEPGLLAFWQRQGYRSVRLSHRRGSVSGSYSVVVLRADNRAGLELLDAARACSADDLPMALGDSHRELEPAIALALLSGLPVATPSVDDWVVATDVASGHRLPEARPAALWRVVVWLLACAPDALDEQQRYLLLLRVVQRQSWKVAAGSVGLTGRAQAVKCLRSALSAAAPLGQ